MNALPRTLSALALVAVAAFAAIATTVSAAPPAEETTLILRHLTLSRSAPAANASVASPAEIRLWFSQEPQRNSTRLTLTGPGGSAVTLGDVTVDPENNRSFGAAVSAPLAPGSYLLAWRTMASDGHVIRGDFRFVVTAD